MERYLIPARETRSEISALNSRFIATGLARPDSDIDAIIFLDPFDWYIVPAEFKWRPSDGTFNSSFQPGGRGGRGEYGV